MGKITGIISYDEISGVISADELTGIGIFQDVLPVVTTAEASDITDTTASGGGNVTFKGTFPVTVRGVCWSTSENPTISDDKTEDGSGEGSFTSEMTELEGSTTYYIRAYAISLAGISYGDQVSFETESGDSPLTLVTSTICKVWLDGKDSSMFSLNGNKVIQWDCKGALNADMLNAIDAQRPTYDAGTGKVIFNNANLTFLQSAVFGAALSQPNTVFIVYKITGDLAHTETAFDAVTNLGQTIYFASSKFAIYSGAVLQNGATDGDNNIHVALFNGASSEYWINGVLKVSGNVGVTVLNGITLGARGGLGFNLDGEICEVIVYNAEITEEERIAVTLYLKNKWELTY